MTAHEALSMEGVALSSQNGSPGSNASQSQLLSPPSASFTSMGVARKKKSDRPPPLPPDAADALVVSPAYANHGFETPHEALVASQRLYKESQGSLAPELEPRVPQSSTAPEVIEVQILPQDDNWGRVQTDKKDDDSSDDLQVKSGPNLSMVLFKLFCMLMSALALATPVLMAALPVTTNLLGLREHQLQCGLECDGVLVALFFKLLFLTLASWALFFRGGQPRHRLPRVRLQRVLLLVLLALVLLAFWLFYLSHVLLTPHAERVQYEQLVVFASQTTDALLFLHYLSLLILELRQRGSNEGLVVKVLRSPDGEARFFELGAVAVQEAALVVLNQYYAHFPVFNPFLEQMGRGKGNVKVYDIDGPNDGNSTVVSVNSRRAEFAGVDEHEWERKVRRRRQRLVAATEEAFTHIRRLDDQDDESSRSSMSSRDAAQAIFPTVARPLQKYLRATRQQPFHSMDSILTHLTHCLHFDLSAKAFLEKFISNSPVLHHEKESLRQEWALISELSLYREVGPGTIFQLRQNDVTLLCQVRARPELWLHEEIIEDASNRFVLRINSETSV